MACGRGLPDIPAPTAQEETPLFLAAREGAVEVAQLLLGLGAARGLRDHAGLAPGDIARQRNHWDLLTLLEGAGPAEARHKAAPGRQAGAFPRARTASAGAPPRGGGAQPRGRTLSAGARPPGGGACLHARTAAADSAERRPGAYSRCRSRSGDGPPPRGPRLSTGTRGPRPSPATVRGRAGDAAGRSDSASAEDGPCDWVALGACGPAPSTAVPPPCLTPSPERASPQLAWGLPVTKQCP